MKITCTRTGAANLASGIREYRGKVVVNWLMILVVVVMTLIIGTLL